MIRRLIIFLLVAASPLVCVAEEGPALPFQFKPNLGNEASLQRGAKLYMNYCSGCHTLKYMRYNRIATDLNIPEDLAKKNLVLARDKFGDQIVGTMPAKAADWLGTAPPDLTLVTRRHEDGAKWVYNFLLSFYLDDKTNTGSNNLVLKNTAMPDVVWPMQGFQRLVEPDKAGESHAEGGHHGEAEPRFEIVRAGSMNKEEYRRAVGDITNFLVYAGEPAKMVRYGLGMKVIAFLVLFAGLAWLLKREYWRDVH